MSHVTLDTCGCVIDNGDDGETFKMVYPCDLHADPAAAIAECRAKNAVKAMAQEAGEDGWTVRDDDGSFHVAQVDVFSGVVTNVAASCEPLTLDGYLAIVEPINAARAKRDAGLTDVRAIAPDLSADQVDRLKALFAEQAKKGP